MDRANTFEKVFSDLAGVYISGTFDFLENKHGEHYMKICEKIEEIETNWDWVTDNQFAFMCKSFKKLLLEGIMLGRKHV